MLFLFLCTCFCIAFTQEKHEVINRNIPNIKLVEHLIKTKVDSIRGVNGLASLVNDSILYLSSIDHARYLTIEQKLSHYQQKNRKKRTYHDRAIQFGAEDYYVSENLAHIKLLPSTNNLEDSITYSQVANLVIDFWKQSEGSMANILAPSHVLAGVAAWYNFEKHELRVAFNFAAVTKEYKHRKYPGLFPYSKHLDEIVAVDNSEKPIKRYEWGINPRPGRKVQDDYKKISRKVNTLGMILRNDSVFVIFNNARRVESLFEGRSDGLAIEVVPYNYYSCSTRYRTPIRSEVEYTIKGILLQPVYRDYLMQPSDNQKRKPKVDLKFIGLIPKELAKSPYTINLVVLKSNRIADVITFVNTPSKVFDLNLSLSPSKDSLPHPNYFIPHLRRDTLMLRVYFDQNKADVIARLGDSIRNWSSDKIIQRAAVFAYASVEGPWDNNKDLSERRASEMISYFDPKDGQKLSLVKVTKENWQLFFDQIMGSKYHFLTQLDTTQIRNYVNQRINSRDLEPILARQRYADLKILAYKVIDDLSIDGLALAEYNNIFNDLKRNCLSQKGTCRVEVKTLNRIEHVYLFLLNRMIDNRIPWNTIERLPVQVYPGEFNPNNEPFAKLYYNRLRFHLAYHGEHFSALDSLSVLKELNRFPYPDPIITYNYFVALLKSKDLEGPEPFHIQRKLNEMNRLITSLEAMQFDPFAIEKLKLYYHFKNVEQEYFINRLGDFEITLKRSLDFIFSFYQRYPPDNKEYAMDMALYFSSFQRYDEALLMLEPYAFASQPCKKSLELYLKFYYANPRVKQNTDFFQLIKDAGDVFSSVEWCSLFKGDTPISIQVLDHEPLHIMYCRMCASP